MHAADIHCELAIDEDPHVVVTGEPEDLAGGLVVDERPVEFEGEVEVAVGRSARIPEELALDRDEAAEPRVDHIGLVVEDVGAVLLANELDGDVWVEKVVLDVAAPVDVAALRRSGDLVGDLLRTIDAVSSDDHELATLAEELRPLGLKASLELSQAGIDLEDPDRLRQWLRQAEGLLVSHLLEVER